MKPTPSDDAAYGHLSRQQRIYIATLRRRVEHLNSRIASTRNVRLTYDEDEVRALQWALSVIAVHAASDTIAT